MTKKLRSVAAVAVISALLAAAPVTSHAQSGYPERAITMINPFAPGSGFDGIVRYISSEVSDVLGQQIIVENVSGAGGIIGTERAVTAEPDGYTLAFHSVSSAAVNPAVNSDLSFNAEVDMMPLVLVSSYPLAMLTHNSFSAEDIEGFITHVRENPGTYSYGSSGVATGIHLGSELFKMQAGLDLLHIPYRGTAEALTDLMGERVDMALVALPTAAGPIRSGQVRPLAVTTAQRSKAFPDIPTLQEAGLDGYDLPFWNGIFAPAGTNQEVVSVLVEAIQEVLERNETAEWLAQQGAEVVGMGPEEFKEFWLAQIAVYREVANSPAVDLD